VDKIKILFLAANPKDTNPLRIGEEVSAIEEELLMAKFREKFDLEQEHAVKAEKLSKYLLDFKPDIVHFSGHGSKTGQIYLESTTGMSHPVGLRALTNIFSVLRDNIRCVVLNACYSEAQARAISSSIDCVLGMSKAIGDEAAIRFAQGFYRGIGYGRDLETSFKLGCAQIDLLSLEEESTPRILWKDDKPRKIVFGQPLIEPRKSEKLSTESSEISSIINKYLDNPNSLNEKKAWKSFKELLLLLEEFSSDLSIEDEYEDLNRTKLVLARLRRNRDDAKNAGLYENASKTEDVILSNFAEVNKKIREIRLKL
jgi:hypothetical protein